MVLRLLAIIMGLRAVPSGVEAPINGGDNGFAIVLHGVTNGRT